MSRSSRKRYAEERRKAKAEARRPSVNIQIKGDILGGDQVKAMLPALIEASAHRTLVDRQSHPHPIRFSPESERELDAPDAEDWRVPAAMFCFGAMLVLVLIWMVGWSVPRGVIP